jgi:hypothetical protein
MGFVVSSRAAQRCHHAYDVFQTHNHLLIMGLFSFFSSAKAKDSSESPHLVQQAIDLSDKGDYEAGV